MPSTVVAYVTWHVSGNLPTLWIMWIFTWKNLFAFPEDRIKQILTFQFLFLSADTIL